MEADEIIALSEIGMRAALMAAELYLKASQAARAGNMAEARDALAAARDSYAQASDRWDAGE